MNFKMKASNNGRLLLGSREKLNSNDAITRKQRQAPQAREGNILNYACSKSARTREETISNTHDLEIWRRNIRNSKLRWSSLDLSIPCHFAYAQHGSIAHNLHRIRSLMHSHLMPSNDRNTNSNALVDSRLLLPVACLAIGILLDGSSASAAAGIDQYTDTVSSSYVPSDVSLWKVYVGFFAGMAPFIVAAIEFGKRIVIQRRCKACQGSGLITREFRVNGVARRRKYKCKECGGFLPWESWSLFLSSEAGNGGVLRQPKGQTSVFYSVPKATVAKPKDGDDGFTNEQEN